MDDTISRKAAIAELDHGVWGKEYDKALAKAMLESLPSARADIHYRKMGEWDMFELITSTWYGKQYYFLQDDNEIVYSRSSGKYMSVDKAIEEFLSAIGDDGSL